MSISLKQDFPQNILMEIRQIAWQQGKLPKVKWQLETRAPGGFRKPQHNPESIRDTTGTADAFELGSARPHGIPRVEGSTRCLPAA